MDSCAFFETALTAFDQATTHVGGAIERDYIVGRHRVRLRFAGPALLTLLTPALAHLALPEPPPIPLPRPPLPLSGRGAGGEGRPSLTVHIWDSVSTRTAMPSPPWTLDDYGVGGEVRSLLGGPVHAVVQLGPSILSLYHRERGQAVYWVKAAAQIPYYEVGAPLRLIFQQWSSEQGLLMVHAGAVGDAYGGVLLAGKGGSGKSNTALACLTSDLQYASDDFCLVAPQPEPTVYSLYSTGKTHAANIQRLPFLASMVSNRDALDTEKALYFVHAHRPHKIVTHLPIRAILAPRVTGQAQTRLQPASATDALAALAPSTLILAPSAARATFQALAQLVRRLPCYHLDLGTDRTAIPHVIQRLIHELAP